MKKMICIITFVFVCFSTVQSQTITDKNDPFITKVYYSGGTIKEVTITVSSGEIITLTVPKNISLSIYSDKEIISKDKDLNPVEFGGKLSIRTKPFSEMKDGSAGEQFVNAPNRIDLTDAKVKVVVKKWI